MISVLITAIITFNIPFPAGASSNADSSIAGLQKYLPTEFIPNAEKALRATLLSRKGSQAPLVEFVSGQSYTSSGLNIVNRIRFFSGKQTDVWLMKQHAEGHGAPSRGWTTLTLLVDKSTAPKTAYFLQWDHDPEKPAHLHPAPFTAMCFTCHPNGPRAIRPQYKPSLVPIDGSHWNQIYDWNDIISDYGEIKTYKPRVDISSNELPIDLPGRMDNEPLKNKFCIECHSKGSGVRSPLLRQHGDSILAMVENISDPTGYYVPALHEKYAFMPLVGHKLSVADMGCLKDWIQNRFMGPPAPGCSQNGEALPPARH